MINRILLIMLVLAPASWIFGQSGTNTNNSVLLRHERTYGANVHSAGWGINYSQAWFQTAFKRHKTEFDFVGMKHPKEVRSLNAYDASSKSFVYGKLNYVYVLRGGYGIQRTITTKPLLNGVEYRRIYSGGFSLAFTKPVYLYVSLPDSVVNNVNHSQAVKYNPDDHSAHAIKGRGPFNKGFDEIAFYPGVYGKLALNFEFGSEYETIRAIEVGAVIDLYPKAIPIMAYTEPNHVFINFYLALLFGSRYNK